MKQTTDSCTRRNWFLSIAQSLIVEKGFHGATVAEMAERSGVSIGQIYRYFINKEAITAAIVDRYCAMALPSFPTEVNDPADLSAMILRALVRWEANEVSLRSEIMSEAVRNPSVRSAVQSAEDQMRERILCALSAAIPDAVPEDISLLIELTFCLSIGAAQRGLLIRHETKVLLMDGAIALLAREIARIRNRLS